MGACAPTRRKRDVPRAHRTAQPGHGHRRHSIRRPFRETLAFAGFPWLFPRPKAKKSQGRARKSQHAPWLLSAFLGFPRAARATPAPRPCRSAATQHCRNSTNFNIARRRPFLSQRQYGRLPQGSHHEKRAHYSSVFVLLMARSDKRRPRAVPEGSAFYAGTISGGTRTRRTRSDRSTGCRHMCSFGSRENASRRRGSLERAATA